MKSECINQLSLSFPLCTTVGNWATHRWTTEVIIDVLYMIRKVVGIGLTGFQV